jgi:hypothetical protein
MKTYTLNRQSYRLPDILSPFQLKMYVHLVNWKWAHITRAPGMDRGVIYDTVIPKEQFAEQLPLLYPAIVPAFKEHHKKYHFRIHKHFFHMASSQAANVNLFLPILLHPKAGAVLALLKPDFARLATDELNHGYRIEFWDEGFGSLADKKGTTGTDADIAIAYYNHQDQLCLWMIEHKLTEKEFTNCGGAKSHRRKERHSCDRTYSEILANKNLCFYHDMNKYNYWTITEINREFFSNHASHARCPFRSGINQLWRNQLLALAIERDEEQLYQHVAFSVVKHPGNDHLDKSLAEYRQLIANNPRFSVFTSSDVVEATSTLNDPELDTWITWYRDLYAL